MCTYAVNRYGLSSVQNRPKLVSKQSQNSRKTVKKPIANRTCRADDVLSHTVVHLLSSDRLEQVVPGGQGCELHRGGL